ncbi:MAG: pyridoxamine 5'-phosphate oxidase family protein [Candidatus Schekmanbacteria bacterium]|nr:MAG: pyridoxamine 5'-phosphate oxidase family protein [Candidatus Schekmanbacteria bacterium]
MARINIAKISAPEQAMFEKKGIKIRTDLSVEEVEKEIVDYLASNNVLHLATCSNNIPRSTPLEYHSEGMNLYVISEGGGKFANLKVNPKVSVSIASEYKPLEDFFGARGVQIWGEAQVCTKQSNPELFEEGLRVINPLEVLKQLGITQLPESFNYKIIKIIPEKIAYNYLRGGFRMVTWYRD